MTNQLQAGTSPLSHLNPPQLQAVTCLNTAALVLAGAGSGKTRVLTSRILWLVQQEAIPPAHILAVTFTNKAAREMQERLCEGLPGLDKHVWVGTFHGICHRLLRLHASEAGLPTAFQIIDTQEQIALVRRLLKEMNIDEERYPARNVVFMINHAKEQGIRAESATTELFAHATQVLALYQQYEARCFAAGIVDFTELMLRTCELLTRNELLAKKYHDLFQHILIDEFQDTNDLQYRWLKLLAPPQLMERACVFAVGDDDQSIYAFRGANVGNMQALQQDYKIADIIRLEQNYRSTENILTAANALIDHNGSRMGKNLWTDSGEGAFVKICKTLSDIDEAQWIVETVRELQQQADYVSGEVAVLYRSNAQSRVIEHTLFNMGISYRVYGGMRFFERAEIKAALAYLRLVANPHDDSALLRVVNFPARGIGNRTLANLQQYAQAHQVSLWDASESLNGRALSSLKAFQDLIIRWQVQIKEGASLAQCIEQITYDSGLRDHYERDKEGASRLENLVQLLDAANQFQAQAVENESSDQESSTPKDLIDFLAHAALEAGDYQEAEIPEVQLMTIHAAKGLEFRWVLIVGLEEGLFPHENSLSDPRSLEEERRLMYVAMTRARQQLFMSHTQSRMLHGKTRYNVESRFLRELPLQVIQRESRGGGDDSMFGNFAYGAGSQSTGLKNRSSLSMERYAQQTGDWYVGQKVSHAKFGTGVIMGMDGTVEDLRVQVNFSAYGVKWLSLTHAKLVVLS